MRPAGLYQKKRSGQKVNATASLPPLFSLPLFFSLLLFFSGPAVTLAQVDPAKPDGPANATQDNPVKQEATAEQEAAGKAFETLLQQDGGQALNQQVRHLVLNALPERYVDDKKWNQSQEIKTLIPRDKPLIMKHGTWQKYEIVPVDPNTNIDVRISEIRSGAPGKIQFTLELDSLLDLDARQAKWVRGVQLYSFNVAATAKTTLALQCEVEIKLDFSRSAELVVSPRIENSQLTIHEFRVHRVSKIGGELAQQVTRATRDWLDSHTEKNNQKITDAINKQIVKKQEKLRFPLSSDKQ